MQGTEIDHKQVHNKKATNAQSGNKLKEENRYLSCSCDTITNDDRAPEISDVINDDIN